MRHRWLCAAFAIADSALALTVAAAAGALPLAREALSATSAKPLAITSDAFQANQAIPMPYSQEGENFSPALSWPQPPAGTKSVAIIVEDPDATEPKPFVHWMLYNLPPSFTRLHESIPNLPQLPAFNRARQGRNSRGTIGYVGPRPPSGDAPHHYHFEVFALDRPLPVAPGADRDTLLAAMKGHVLAAGEIVGTFRRP